jgi:hypothetical protein
MGTTILVVDLVESTYEKTQLERDEVDLLLEQLDANRVINASGFDM